MMITILSINIMHHFYHQRIMQMYLLDKNMIQKKEEIIVMDLLLNKPKSFEWYLSLLFFCFKRQTFSSHMSHISEHVSSSNHNIHRYYHMSKIIVDLGNKKCKNNNSSTCQLSIQQHSLLMSIVETLEKNLRNFDQKSDIRKVCTYPVKSSSTLFFCSIREIYYRVNRATKKHLMLNYFLPRINTLIFSKEALRL